MPTPVAGTPAPVVIGTFDRPEPDINLPYPVAPDPVAPPFEDTRPTETDDDEDGAMGGNADGFGGIDGFVHAVAGPAVPPGGWDSVLDGGNPDERPDEPGDGQPDETPAKSGKSKKWLIVIAVGIVLWLLIKKRK